MTSPRIRLWPALVIITIAAAATIWIWTVDEAMRQDRVAQTAITVVLTLLALALWSMFFARFARRTRGRLALLTLVTVGVGIALFRHKGFTGDMVPLFAFRWSGRRALETPLNTGEAGRNTLLSQLSAGDFWQFLGPRRDGVLSGVRLARDWKASPPRELWRVPIGAGWSGFAVAGGRAYTQEQRAEQECVVCRDVDTGEVVWAHGEKAQYVSSVAGDGPRSTPTITERHVITLGSTGLLTCLDRGTGKLRWSVDVLKTNDTEVPKWGYSCSPLVLAAPMDAGGGASGDMAVVTAGGRDGTSLVAYDADTGSVVWAGGRSPHSYSSPLVATLAGLRQIVVLNNQCVAGHDPETGRELWTHPWPGTHPKVPQPLVIDENRLLLTSGYGVGCELIRVTANPDRTSFTTERIWRTKRLKSKFSNSVCVGEFVYGLDDGILVCLDLKDGQRRWKRGRYGHGQVFLVDGVLLITSEQGDVALVEPTPDAFREWTRFRAFDTRCWAPPALVGDRLFLRSDEEAACYALPLRD